MLAGKTKSWRKVWCKEGIPSLHQAFLHKYREVLEQVSDEDRKLGLNNDRVNDSFHARDFMHDDEGEENPELGRRG
jgi:hypothetical protein